MSTSEPIANGHSALASSTASLPAITPPPEIEATLSRLSAYRNVKGVMIISRRETESSGHIGAIVQSTGAIFDGEGGRRYARALESVVANVAGAVGECDDGDELRLMRIRTKRHELIITPDEKYLLVVLQDPGQ
ncbi:hypothetical protein BCR39DRAFT_521225, partial [Naematelia encephala]